MTKYHAKRTTIDGITFASQKEAKRYQELKLLERGGVISALAMQVPYVLSVNGDKICKYIADFAYVENATLVIEDAKGFKTPVYRLKKKLLKALYGIEIREV